MTQIEHGPDTSYIHYDEASAADVLEQMESSVSPRIYDPLSDASATERLGQQRQAWRDEGQTVVFTSGVFDVFHANHRGYLLAAILSAVPRHYDRFEAHSGGYEWQALTPYIQRDYTQYALEEEIVKQIVSVDGNLAVAQRKGHTTGGTARPIYDWQTRARDLLTASVAKPYSNSASFLVHAATLHDKFEPTLRETPHAGIMEIGSFVTPDVWAIYFESKDIIQALEVQHRAGTHNSNIHPTVVTARDFYHDKLLNSPLKTTALVNRLKS